VAEVRDLELAGCVLVHGKRVDHAHRVALTQTLELGLDLPVELRVSESEHDQLHRPDCHIGSFSRWTGGTVAPSPGSGITHSGGRPWARSGWPSCSARSPGACRPTAGPTRTRASRSATRSGS